MLRILRHIRKSLIETLPTSPAGKYVLYAIGEILLVVIGILLALQINTWNTNRVNREIEQTYISRLTDELKSEVAYFEKVQTDFQNRRDRLSRLVDFWNSDDQTITDSLEYIIDFISVGTVGPFYNEPITWTQLIQTGDLKLVKDQKLIDILFSYYSYAKKVAQNFEQHPMNKINEARNMLPPLLLDDKMESIIGSRWGESMKIPSAKVFQKIQNRKAEMIDLFTTNAFISNVNQYSVGGIIKRGHEVIAYLQEMGD